MKNELNENILTDVTGGAETPDEITVKIKELPGDNDEYVIKLSDATR